MQKIGIMGGTFDPIHIGHLIAASSALEGASLDEVWFIPTAAPPLKPNAPLATDFQRYEMVQLAIEDEPRFKVLDIELNRGGTSYSIDTVTSLRQQYPNHKFSYIIGTDRINDLPKWHRAEELLAMIDFIGLNRASETLHLDKLSTVWQEKIKMVAMPQIELSSTTIRERIREGKSPRYFVTKQVEHYIRRFALYE